MRIGIVNTFDSGKGAARAAYRLHQGLLKSGNHSTMFVQKKESEDQNVSGPNSKYQKLKSLLFPTLDSLPLMLYPKRDKRTFSIGCLSSLNVNNYIHDFDVINLHWTSAGFQSIKSISNISKPTVITLHDSWIFTGGCHIPFECEKFISKCGSCMQLNSNTANDLSYKIWRKKFNAFNKKNIILVGDGNWVANNARSSSIFRDTRIEVVHPGLDLNIYKPINKEFSRELLGLANTDRVILFGAISATADYNKGFHLLVPALKKLVATFQDKKNLKLIVFGASSSAQPDLNIGIETKYIGKLSDDISLSILYSAADVMIVPSIQECFGQTASESFACGTPVVAFRTSGLIDIIDHKVNGFLAKPYDPLDLAEGISWILSDPSRLIQLSFAARQKAINNFSIEKCVNEYLRIFTSIQH
jgi:glycosyltransferase involved in cell wall biosynthesis